MPTVSIGLPVYNGGNYIEEALSSLLCQTFSDFEVVISDNASTDNTEEICRDFSKKDQRIRYLRNTINLGAGRNYNNVFEQSEGKYFKWASHDDICGPTFIEECVKVLDDDDATVLCYPKTTIIDQNGDFVCHYVDISQINSQRPSDRFKKFLFRENVGECNAVFGLIRSSCLAKTSLIKNYVGADYTLLAQLAILGKFHQINQDLFFRRDHPNTSVRANPENHQVEKWYNPSHNKSIILPFSNLIYEYFMNVIRADLDFFEKVICITFLLKRIASSRSKIKRELKKGFRDMVGC